MKKNNSKAVAQTTREKIGPEKLIFIGKVEKGLAQLNEGNMLTHDQVKQKVKEWQK